MRLVAPEEFLRAFVGKYLSQCARVVVGCVRVEKTVDIRCALFVLGSGNFACVSHGHQVHLRRVFFFLKRILICIDPIEC